MYVIVDRRNVIFDTTNDLRFVKIEKNGVIVGTKTLCDSQYLYLADKEKFYPTKFNSPTDTIYSFFEVDSFPENIAMGTAVYNNGEISVDEELYAQHQAAQEEARVAYNRELQTRKAAKMLAEQQTDDENIVMFADLYDSWEADRTYKTGKILSYGVTESGNTQLYRVVQDHTSQSDWKPDATSSLYSKIGFTPSGVEMWIQPTGAHNAYKTGAIVEHNGKKWESTVDGNVWEPGVVPDVWKEVE